MPNGTDTAATIKFADKKTAEEFTAKYMLATEEAFDIEKLFGKKTPDIFPKTNLFKPGGSIFTRQTTEKTIIEEELDKGKKIPLLGKDIEKPCIFEDDQEKLKELSVLVGLDLTKQVMLDKYDLKGLKDKILSGYGRGNPTGWYSGNVSNLGTKGNPTVHDMDIEENGATEFYLQSAGSEATGLFQKISNAAGLKVHLASSYEGEEYIHSEKCTSDMEEAEAKGEDPECSYEDCKPEVFETIIMPERIS